MSEKKFYVKAIIFSMFVAIDIICCPIKIVNDSENPIIILDTNNQQARYLEPGKSSIIDPTIRKFPQKYLSWFGLVTGETIDFYIQDSKNEFYLGYRLHEKYCDTTETISLSTIKKWVDHPPADRFTVTKFKKPEKTTDGYIDHSH